MINPSISYTQNMNTDSAINLTSSKNDLIDELCNNVMIKKVPYDLTNNQLKKNNRQLTNLVDFMLEPIKSNNFYDLPFNNLPINLSEIKFDFSSFKESDQKQIKKDASTNSSIMNNRTNNHQSSNDYLSNHSEFLNDRTDDALNLELIEQTIDRSVLNVENNQIKDNQIYSNDVGLKKSILSPNSIDKHYFLSNDLSVSSNPNSNPSSNPNSNPNSNISSNINSIINSNSNLSSNLSSNFSSNLSSNLSSDLNNLSKNSNTNTNLSSHLSNSLLYSPIVTSSLSIDQSSLSKTFAYIQSLTNSTNHLPTNSSLFTHHFQTINDPNIRNIYHQSIDQKAICSFPNVQLANYFQLFSQYLESLESCHILTDTNKNRPQNS